MQDILGKLLLISFYSPYIEVQRLAVDFLTLLEDDWKVR